MKTKKKKTLSPPPPQEKVESLEWSVEPESGDWSGSPVHIWITDDEKYKVARVDSPTLGKVVFGAEYRSGWGYYTIEFDSRLGSGYPKYYKSLEEAFVVVEIFHLKKSGKETVKTNMEAVLAHAHKLGLDGAKPVRIDRSVAEEEPGGERPAPARRSEGKMGCLDACYRVLCEEGRPMDLKELIKVMSERGYWTSAKGLTPWATLGAAIGVSSRNGDTRFVKVGKGTFQANK